MKNNNKAHRILWYECAGFLAIILMSWLDELLKLPQRLFGGVQRPSWREAAIETLVILFVWLVVFVLTGRIIVRLHYLEGMVKMCAWCRRLDQNGKWVAFEEYIVRDMHTTTSHGMCPECEARMLGRIPEEAQNR
jgi:tryptophan-rich sensory protein